MATNFHADLPNNQIHVPKDFETANQSSLPIKNLSSNLEWSKANYSTVSTIKTTADAFGSLHGTFVNVFLNATDKFNVYYNVTGQTSIFQPLIGFTGLEVVIISNDSAIVIAQKTATAVNAVHGFTSTSSSNIVTVSGMLSAEDTIPGASPFFCSNIQTPVGNEVLKTDSSGNIVWGVSPPSGLVTSLTTNGTQGSSTLVSGVLNIPEYDSKSFLSQNIEGYGMIAAGIEWGISNAQYNAEHKFTSNLGASPVSVITPKNMVNCSVWSSPIQSTLQGWNGWIYGNGEVTLSLLRVATACPLPAPAPTTIPACRTASVTLLLQGNNIPVCWSLNSFITCSGMVDELGVNEMLILTASCTGKSAEFNMNSNILFKI